MADTSRKLAQGSLATTGVLVALGIAIAANLVASQLHVRADMTANEIYTLSEASAEAVSGLESPVTVKVFISPDMPPPMHTIGERLADLLSEYQAASGGDLTYQIISPRDGDEAVEEEAAGYGCEKVAIGQRSEDEVSLRAVYKCVAFIQGDRQEVIRDLRMTGNPEVDNFEYDFTRALLNLTRSDEDVRKLAFVGGFGGPAQTPQFAQSAEQIFAQLYGDLIKPTHIDLGKPDATIPDDVVALVLLDPSEAFTPRAKFLIDQFLQRGGSIGWYQSSTAADEKIRQQLMKQMPGQQLPDIRQPVDTDLNDLFGAYGVTHNQDLIVDPSNGMTSMVLTQQGVAQITNPAVFQINDMDRSLPFMTNLPPVVLPTPSSLTLDPSLADSDAIQVFEAMRTSDEAMKRTELPTARNYESLVQAADGDATGTYVLAAALQGTFPSYYDDHELPDGVTEDDRYKGERKPGRIFVIGSGDFLMPLPQIGYEQRLAGIGQQLFFASLEWLAQDNALSSIRDKKMPRFIGEVDQETQFNVQFINIAVVPACFAGIGFLMMMRRRRRREQLGELG